MDEVVSLRANPLPRRGLLISGLISGFTLATTKVDAQAIHTDTVGLNAGEAKMPTRRGDLPAYYARPHGTGPFPILLVIEEAYGVHEHIKDICRRLAKLGYLAVATEYYARIGDLSKMTDIQQITRDVINRAPDAQMMSDMDATVDWAAVSRGDLARLGIVGFCRGGRGTWLYAAYSSRLKAAVAWYGPLTTPDTDIQPNNPIDIAADIKCPLLGLYGGKDPGIPLSAVREVEQKAKAGGKTVDIVIFPDAGHAFNADYRPSYREADAKKAWGLMLDWFRKYGLA